MVRFIINRKTNYLYKKSILKIQYAFYFHFILSSQTIYKNQILLYNCFYYNYYFIICCVCRVKGLLLLWNVKISHPDLALSLFLQAVLSALVTYGVFHLLQACTEARSFVLIYLFFLLILGLPIMVAEFSVGRASCRSAALSFDVLEPKGTKWHLYKYGAIAGNYILMMFYTTVAGWMLYYFYKMAVGDFAGLDAKGVGALFGGLLGDPLTMTFNMVLTVLVCFGVCLLGLQAGVEKITKTMMLCLLILMLALAANSMFLPGAEAGLKYYLYPDFNKVFEKGVSEVIFAAMGQAFFTLSLGIGALAIFGSYIAKERSLTGEAVFITILDTAVALISGLIIFPACFSFGVNPDSGPNLLFVTLPNVFNAMPWGQFWGALFFLFMIFASYSTVIAVFENITACIRDLYWLEAAVKLFISI